MKEYNINVNFKEGTIETDFVELVQNDFNSTTFNFKFDDTGERILFKMKYPDGETEYVNQIYDNTIVLGPGLLSQDGMYQIEISLYKNSGRLTAYATMEFYVRQELIDTDELVEVDDRVPILDELITEVDNIDVDAVKVDDIATITITKKDGTTKTVDIEDGETGPAGKDGADGITPTIGANENWYIGETDTGKPSRGAAGQAGKDGADGKDGTDGFSPIANVSKSGSTATITITDENGTTTASVSDGTDGQDGQDGTDGFSPIASVTKSGNTATISITDKNGTTTATVSDGTNGQDGQNGVGVPSGGTTGQILAKTSNTDYATEWIDAGSDLPLYLLELNYRLDDYSLEITNSDDKVSASNIINAIYNSNKKYGVLILRSNNTWYEKTYIVTQKGVIGTTSGTQNYYFYTCSAKDMKDTSKFYIWKELRIYGTWNNNVFTCSNLYWDVSNVLDTSQILYKNNTYSYTPTADYHPATKKYVDDNAGGVDNLIVINKTNSTIEEITDDNDNTGYKITNQELHDVLLTEIDEDTGDLIYTDFKLMFADTGFLELDKYSVSYGVVDVENDSRKLTFSYDFEENDIYVLTASDEEGEEDVVYMTDADYHFLADADNVLTLNNTTAYTPTNDYNPATKKYVDDNASSSDTTTYVVDLRTSIYYYTDATRTFNNSDTLSELKTALNKMISGGSVHRQSDKICTINSSNQNYSKVLTFYPFWGNTLQDAILKTNSLTQTVKYVCKLYAENIDTTGKSFDNFLMTINLTFNNNRTEVSTINSFTIEMAWHTLATTTDVLTKTNTTAYTPTADYHPATKKYVDDNVGSDLPIYLFETSVNVTHNVANFSNSSELSNLSEIINAIYGTTRKSGVILLHSSTSNTQFMFLQKGELTTSTTQVDFYTNTVARDMSDSSRIMANIHLSIYGTWSNNVFTCSGGQFWPEDVYSLSGFITTSGNQSVSGKKTFTTLPESSVVPTTDDQLVNKKYVDDNAGGVDIDESSITLNSSDKIQTVGVIDNNSGTTNKLWTGTLAQYNGIQTKDADTFYYITDDDASSTLRQKVEVITSSASTYTIANLTANKTYKLGELTSLTITACDMFDEESVIYFDSGSTATVLSLPNDVTQIGDTAIDTNYSYIISILNKIAVIKAYEAE